MGFLCFKTPTQVQKQRDAIENFMKGDDAKTSIFRNLGSNLSEEARVRAAAIEKQQQAMGGFLTQQGRVRDSTIDTALKSLYDMISMPGHFDGFVALAVLSIFLHLILIASWVLTDYGRGGVDGMLARSLGVLTLNDTTTRLATMYVAGHVLLLAIVIHACVGSEVRHYTPLYSPLMLVCTVIGGPACAMAVNAHCEEQARLKVQKRIDLGDIPTAEVEEQRGAVADCMQWIYLCVLAVVAFASLSAFGTAALDPRDGDIDQQALIFYYAWPYDLLRSSTREWLTPLTALIIADWVGVWLFSMLNAAADHRHGSMPLLGISESFDLFLRLLFVLITALPSPHIGLTLYQLLECRAKALHPLLPSCSGGIRGPLQPRAMATWQARVEADTSSRALSMV
uniref:Uncharacterized protein n=1 Tax=Haptolina brevifila TaxID=156173 RepID=A0A7S2GRW1_9EUKA